MPAASIVIDSGSAARGSRESAGRAGLLMARQRAQHLMPSHPRQHCDRHTASGL